MTRKARNRRRRRRAHLVQRCTLKTLINFRRRSTRVSNHWRGGGGDFLPPDSGLVWITNLRCSRASPQECPPTILDRICAWNELYSLTVFPWPCSNLLFFCNLVISSKARIPGGCCSHWKSRTNSIFTLPYPAVQQRMGINEDAGCRTILAFGKERGKKRA